MPPHASKRTAPSSRDLPRLRADIIAQLRSNQRTVLVDCLGSARIQADPLTWDLLRALAESNSGEGVVARLAERQADAGITEADIHDFLSTQGSRFLEQSIPSSRAEDQTRREQAKVARAIELAKFARAHVPHYRQIFATEDLRADQTDLGRLPMLTKDHVRAQFPTGLLAEGLAFGELMRDGKAEVLYSSGTTVDGDRTPSLHLLSEDQLNCASPFGIYAAEELQARFSTPRCTGRECHIELQSREDRTYGKNLILNSSANPLFMSEKALRAVFDELVDWGPTVLAGNPWYLMGLLRSMERQQLALPAQVATVVLGTEFVPETIQAYLTSRCGLLPFDNYSASEVGNIASTCPLGNYHVFDSVLVEVMRDGRPVPVGTLGEVVVTNLERRSMPTIRYKLGDLGTRLPPCECGLPHASLALAGRVSECILTGERFVTPRELDQALSGIEGLLFYRATQWPDLSLAFEFDVLQGREEEAAAVGEALAGKATQLTGLPLRAVKRSDWIHTRESMKFSVVISKVPDVRAQMARLLGNG